MPAWSGRSAARAGAGKHQAIHGPGHAYIAEAPLLLQLHLIIECAGMREQSFFHTDHKNDGEFQTFCCMEGHKGDGIFLAFAVIRLPVRTVFLLNQGNIFQKFQDVYIDGSCRAIKGAESSFGSVTCCSGSLSFYRRIAIQDFIHEWAHDKFLGTEFKFCTDRRMTAYVLGTAVQPQVGSNDSDNQCSG